MYNFFGGNVKLKRSLFLTLIILLVSSTSITWAAVINDVRTNISPTRVRIVLDVDEAIKFKESYDGDSLVDRKSVV